MSNSQAEIDPKFNILIERFAHIKETYGDEYPIIWFDPEIETEEKKNLKDFTQKHKLIHSFRYYLEALEFAKSLGISFILIIFSEFPEQKLFQDFKSLEMTNGQRMSKFEEERLLEDFIKETSDGTIKANKVYVFSTLLDSLTEIGPRSEERDITVIENLNDMAKQFRQEFAIILFDPTMNSEIKERLVHELEIEIEGRNIYTNFEELQLEIRNYYGPPYHLIMSGNNLEEIPVNELIDHQDLLGIYIYCNNTELILTQKGRVVIDKAKTLEDLIPKIKKGIRIRSKLVNSFPTFATNFDALDRSHLYYLHHYLKGFINFNNRRQAKEDFIKLANKIYQSSNELRRFENEYDQYNKNSILNWYTRESPVYKLINNCLRIASSDSIFYCRFVLKDLEQAIRERYREKSHSFNGLVYRGAFLSTDEWEKLQRNVGKEIEMSGFLSTAINKQIAINFIHSDPENKVFITIIVPPLPEKDSQGFADLSGLTQWLNEQEVLFNVRSKFQILQTGIVRLGPRKIQVRHLVLLFGAQLLRKYMTENKSFIPVELNLPPQGIIQCASCGNDANLFGFQQDTTQISCFECLVKNSVPKDIPLIPLQAKDNQHIVTKFKGKILKFTEEAPNFSFSGYICCDCQGNGKENYYKWITQYGGELRQCLRCFEERKEIRSHVLVSESCPFTFWTECQEEWERINSSYDVELSRRLENLNEGEVYLEVQYFDCCIQYGRKVLDSLKFKRWREKEKIRTFVMLGRAYKGLGMYNEALESHLKALEMSRFFSQENSISTILSYHNIALIYQDLGEYQKALDFQTRALDIAKETCGETHPIYAISCHNIALVYESLAVYEKAREFNLKALEIRKSIYGESHPEIAASDNAIASVHENLGEYQQALEFHLKALNIRISIYGEKHPSSATSYQNLASLYKILGDYQRAFEYDMKALEIRKSIFGDSHPEIAASYNTIALVHESLGEYREALRFNQRALEMRKTIFGDFHPETAASYNTIASVHETLGDYREALEYNFKALEIRKSIYGESHPEVATSYQSIASIRKSMGEYKGALEFLRKTLEIRKSFYGGSHPEIATSYHNIALVLQSLGDYKIALEFHHKALDIRKLIYGGSHPEVATSYHYIASLYQTIEDFDKALELQMKGLDIRRSAYGENHPETARSYNNLALMYESFKEHSKALEFHHKARNILLLTFREMHPEVASLYSNIALVHRDTDGNKEALEWSQKALNIMKSVYGESHPDIGKIYSNIASIYEEKGWDVKALNHHLKALDILKDFYDKNNPVMVAAYESITVGYKVVRNFEKAAEYEAILKANKMEKDLKREENEEL